MYRIWNEIGMCVANNCMLQLAISTFSILAVQQERKPNYNIDDKISNSQSLGDRLFLNKDLPNTVLFVVHQYFR